MFEKNRDPEWYDSVKDWRARAERMARWFVKLLILTVAGHLIVAFVFGTLLVGLAVKDRFNDDHRSFANKVAFIARDYTYELYKESFVTTFQNFWPGAPRTYEKVYDKAKGALKEVNPGFFNFLATFLIFATLGVVAAYMGMVYESLLLPVLLAGALANFPTSKLLAGFEGGSDVHWGFLALRFGVVLLAAMLGSWYWTDQHVNES